MNSDTWNAYHIVSNRARAVCYGARQVQFRAKTELAVNKLVTTAEEQLIVMDALKVRACVSFLFQAYIFAEIEKLVPFVRFFSHSKAKIISAKSLKIQWKAFLLDIAISCYNKTC